MKESEIGIRVGKGLDSIAGARNQTFIEWFQDALSLAAAVDDEVVYQKIGEEYQLLQITDIKPFPEEPTSKHHYLYLFESDVYKDIEHKAAGFKDWMLRVIGLGVRAENLDLYVLNGEEYEKIKFVPNDLAK